MRMIDPLDVEPTVNPAYAVHREGRQVHRRILSRDREGPDTIDVGYNRSTSMNHQVPYAYDRDEFCYTAEGSALMTSFGEVVEFKAGMFMWRPAGAATHSFVVESAYNSICAFNPARADRWSHMHSQEKIAEIDGDPQGRPALTFVKTEDCPPLDIPGLDRGIVHRKIFSTATMDVTHTTMPADSMASLGRAGRDEVYFVASGALVASDIERDVHLGSHKFLFSPAQETCGPLRAKTESVVVCWSALGE